MAARLPPAGVVVDATTFRILGCRGWGWGSFMSGSCRGRSWAVVAVRSVVEARGGAGAPPTRRGWNPVGGGRRRRQEEGRWCGGWWMSGAAAGGAGSVVAGATGRGSGRGGGGGRRKKKMARGMEDRERASARLRLPVAGAIASSPPNFKNLYCFSKAYFYLWKHFLSLVPFAQDGWRSFLSSLKQCLK